MILLLILNQTAPICRCAIHDKRIKVNLPPKRVNLRASLISVCSFFVEARDLPRREFDGEQIAPLSGWDKMRLGWKTGGGILIESAISDVSAEAARVEPDDVREVGGACVN
jgi:hypothetical protein